MTLPSPPLAVSVSVFSVYEVLTESSSAERLGILSVRGADCRVRLRPVLELQHAQRSWNVCPDRSSPGIDVYLNLLHPEIYVKTNDLNVFILYLLLCFYTHKENILLLHYSWWLIFLKRGLFGHTNDDVRIWPFNLELREIHAPFVRINTVLITWALLENKAVGR